MADMVGVVTAGEVVMVGAVMVVIMQGYMVDMVWAGAVTVGVVAMDGEAAMVDTVGEAVTVGMAGEVVTVATEVGIMDHVEDMVAVDSMEVEGITSDMRATQRILHTAGMA